jgi:hypothetical protein
MGTDPTELRPPLGVRPDAAELAEVVLAVASIALCTSATMGVNVTAIYSEASALGNFVVVVSVTGFVPVMVRRSAEMVVP